jgi:hypothetical protein
VLAEWDLTLFAVHSALVVCSPRAPSLARVAFRFLLVVVHPAGLSLRPQRGQQCVVGPERLNSIWFRVRANGVVREGAFPVGPVGISLFACGTLALMTTCFSRWGGALDDSSASGS